MPKRANIQRATVHFNFVVCPNEFTWCRHYHTFNASPCHCDNIHMCVLMFSSIYNNLKIVFIRYAVNEFFFLCCFVKLTCYMNVGRFFLHCDTWISNPNLIQLSVCWTVGVKFRSNLLQPDDFEGKSKTVTQKSYLAFIFFTTTIKKNLFDSITQLGFR